MSVLLHQQQGHHCRTILLADQVRSKNTDIEKHTTHMNSMGWCNLSWEGSPPWSHGTVPARGGGGIVANEGHANSRAANLHPPKLTTKHKHTQWTCQVLHVVPQPCANAVPQANLTTQCQHNWHYTWAQTPAPSLQPMGCGQPKDGNWEAI